MNIYVSYTHARRLQHTQKFPAHFASNVEKGEVSFAVLESIMQDWDLFFQFDYEYKMCSIDFNICV